MPQFVFGDSYGGVQSAAQAADNSDRQLLVSLLTAAQQGQALAAQREAMMRQGQSQAAAQALQQQQLAESARQFDVNAAQRQSEQQAGEELGYAQLGLNEDKLQAQNDRLDKQIEQLGQTAQSMGEPLADSFGNAIVERAKAFQSLDDANNAKMAADAEVQNAIAGGVLKLSTNGKQLLPKDSSDPSFTEYAAKMNTQLEKLQSDAQRAQDEAKRSDRALQMITATATKNGFTPDMSNGQLVHAKTGQAFSFLRAINSQPVPIKGSAPPSMPVMPTGPTTGSQPGYFASLWNSLLGRKPAAAPAAAPKILRYDPKLGLVPVQ